MRVQPKHEAVLSDSSDFHAVRGLNQCYSFVETYLVLAMDRLKDGKYEEQLWTRGLTYSTNNDGNKINFHCKRLPKCPERLQISLDLNSLDAHVYVSGDQHNHELTVKRYNKLNPTSKGKVLEWIRIHINRL